MNATYLFHLSSTHIQTFWDVMSSYTLMVWHLCPLLLHVDVPPFLVVLQSPNIWLLKSPSNLQMGDQHIPSNQSLKLYWSTIVAICYIMLYHVISCYIMLYMFKHFLVDLQMLTFQRFNIFPKPRWRTRTPNNPRHHHGLQIGTDWDRGGLVIWKSYPLVNGNSRILK